MTRSGVGLGLCCLCIVVIPACQSSKAELLRADASAVKLRSIQTRAFDTTDKIATLRTVMATLQDLGFVIDNADVVIGTVSATKLDRYRLVMTVTVREKGKTLEQSGGLVLTSDLWLAPKIAAMNEISEFDQKYARKLEGPMVAGASAEEMAGVMAMYPGVTQALAKMRTEDVNMDGTPILSTVTIDSVKSAEQMAEASKQRNEDSGAGAPGGVGGMLGGFAKKMSKKGDSQADQKARATFMTMTNEVLKVAAEVGSEVAIPAGFQQK